MDIIFDRYIRQAQRVNAKGEISERMIDFNRDRARKRFRDERNMGIFNGGISQCQYALGRQIADAIHTKKITVEDAIDELLKAMPPRIVVLLERRFADIMGENNEEDEFIEDEMV